MWVRRVRANVEPSPSELLELYNAFGYIMTEERPIQAAAPGHIDLQSFREYLGELGLDTEDQPQPGAEDDLRNRGVIAELGGALHPTVYGVLAFGKEPQGYPQTRSFLLECVAYEGDDRASETLQVADITGRLDEQVQRAVGWFQGLGRFESYRGLIRGRPLAPAGSGNQRSFGQRGLCTGIMPSSGRMCCSRSMTVTSTSPARAHFPTT